MLAFLLLDVNCDAGLEVYGEVILKDGDLLNQAAYQCLIKLRDVSRLVLDEILQVADFCYCKNSHGLGKEQGNSQDCDIKFVFPVFHMNLL